MICKSYTDIAYSSLIVTLLVALVVSIFLISSHPEIETNQKCRFRNGTSGICVKNSKCFVREKFTGLFIGDDCGGSSDLTCCLQENILPDGTKDFEFHENFKYFRNKKCGVVPHANHNADHHRHDSEFPWIVSLGHINHHSHLKFTCGGSLISKRFILTSAQCVMPLESEFELSVIRLKHNRNLKTEHLDIKDFKIIPHSRFDPVSLKNDIALIKLNTPLNHQITPICLPLEKEETIPYELTSIGRKSKNSKRRSRPSVYQISTKECDRKIKEFSIDSEGAAENVQSNLQINDNQICVEKEVIDHNCTGELGMPLQSHQISKTNNVWTQYGILSYDSSCDLPSVYTNLHKYLRWILDSIDQ